VPEGNLFVFVIRVLRYLFYNFYERRQLVRVILCRKLNFKQGFVRPKGEDINFKILVFIYIKISCFVKHLPAANGGFIFLFGDIAFQLLPYQLGNFSFFRFNIKVIAVQPSFSYAKGLRCADIALCNIACPAQLFAFKPADIRVLN